MEKCNYCNKEAVLVIDVCDVHTGIFEHELVCLDDFYSVADDHSAYNRCIKSLLPIDYYTEDLHASDLSLHKHSKLYIDVEDDDTMLQELIEDRNYPNNINILIKGFKNKEEAECFISWYWHQGDQASEIWWECRYEEGEVPTRSSPMIDKRNKELDTNDTLVATLRK